MPHVVALLFILAALPRVPPSGPIAPERSLTVIIQTGNSDIPEAVSAELKREFSKILSTSGYTFGWRNAVTLSPGDTFDDLVLITFEGACRSDSAVIPYDERGPLGFTHVTDGAVLPFTNVDCDRIRTVIQNVTAGRNPRVKDLLLGRALGRVLAHEVYHILAHTSHHGKMGVTSESLTAQQLTQGELSADESSLELIRKGARRAGL